MCKNYYKNKLTIVFFFFMYIDLDSLPSGHKITLNGLTYHQSVNLHQRSGRNANVTIFHNINYPSKL